MTDKTDALVALADELEAAWNTAKDFDMDGFADRIRALAAPVEGGQGEVVDLGEVIREKVREHGSYRAASKAIGVNYPYLCQMAHDPNRKPSKEILAALGLERVTVTRRLIDSAGGAKGNWRCACGDMNAPNETCGICNQSAPQPAEGDGAVDDTVNILGNVAFADDWFAQFMVEGVMFLAPLDNKEQARHILAAKKRRPSATAVVPDARDIDADYESSGAYSLGHCDGWSDCRNWMLAAAPAAPAAPKGDDSHAFKNFHRMLCERFGYTHDEKDWRRDQVSLMEHIARGAAPKGGVVDALCREARELQRKNYGSGAGLHLDMIDWARKYDAALANQEPRHDALADGEDRLRDEWQLGEYDNGDTGCPKCGRSRLCICPNGKHRCEKCNWSPELGTYSPVRD